MTLVTHQFRGSCVSFPSRPLPSRHFTFKHCGLKLCVVAIGKVDSCFSLKRHASARSRVPPSSLSVSKSVRVLSFKGAAQNDDWSSTSHRSKVSSNLLKLSHCVPRDGERKTVGSPKAHDVPVSYKSEANGVASSPAFQKLFRKWLSILPTRYPEPLVEDDSASKTFESETRIEEREKIPLSKALWTRFWSLDSSIKLPLMIFIPLYLGVNATYGREVSRELTPLWVFGPLLVALYVKLFRGLWALYTFTFNQTVKVFKSLSPYYLLACGYVAHGKLKQDLQAHVWDPAVSIKNQDSKDLSERMIRELRDWLLEKYLDFVESIWPYYCRTIRSWKRANLI
ncbi:hypothetical protein MLD38_027919 [Melastoma candidum]|uniref:Uncharacterized protein n=1 Tax=Melastoma candidum TaxID=119954 RepID=A0ACB9N005_9MYRT|nr:hypothetical protein MLD38_027919 [Melastoma candidum]